MNLRESFDNAIAILTQKIETKKIKSLHLELDYQLSWLNEYIQQKDQPKIEQTKQRLLEIHQELTLLNAI